MALSPKQIEQKVADVGVAKAEMAPARAFVLAVMAGAFVGLGGMFMALVKSDASLAPAASSLLVAGAELFTGNSLMVIGCMHGRYPWARLLASWSVVYVGNLAGALLLVAFLAAANYCGMNGGAVGATLVSVAVSKASLPWSVVFFRGVLCNALVCLAVWMGFAGKTVVDKFVAAILPVMCFVACGFEHCVANMFFLPLGVVARALGFAAPGLATPPRGSQPATPGLATSLHDVAAPSRGIATSPCGT